MNSSLTPPFRASADGWLPLFPLHGVLFPDGVLPLKVFEARYIDMVRDCMRRDAPFGVVLIRSGQETGKAAEPEEVGCLAYITEWDMPQAGVLLLRTRGGERFRILETRRLDNELLEGRVELIAADRPAPAVSDAHVSCARALKTVSDAILARGRAEQGDAFVSPIAAPMQFDQSGWVANRWSEILPIPLKARQKLLELEDAQSRLAVIHLYLQQHNILQSE